MRKTAAYRSAYNKALQAGKSTSTARRAGNKANARAYGG